MTLGESLAHPDERQRNHQLPSFLQTDWVFELKEFIADSKRIKLPSTAGEATFERHLGLADLVLLGVAGSLGSGLFVLAGRAARDVAGPAVSLSFVAAAIACIFSGVSYAEMASRLNANGGGAYSFCYSTIGEFVAFLVGSCLFLEYGVSSAAVARAWAAYIGEVFLWLPGWATGRGSAFSILGCGLMIMNSILIAIGTRETKWVVNTATALYGIVVAIVIGAGAPHVKWSNWSPFIPFGGKSIITGASAVFFSYIGFDEVATVSEEAKNPSKTVPSAILLSLFTVATLYVASTLVLTGMVKYSSIDFDAPFPAAFRSVGLPVLASAIGVGVAIGMINTALVGILAQTRLFLALSNDGLIPRSLGANARTSTVAVGIIVALLALLVQTQALADVVSGGTLLAFLSTNVSLILTRYKLIPGGPRRSTNAIYLYACGCLLFGFSLRLQEASILKSTGFAVGCVAMVSSAFVIYREDFGLGTSTELAGPSFVCPWVPTIPLLGVLTTSMLFAQLSHKALMALSGWLFMAAVVYCVFGRYHSYANDVGPVPNERTAVSQVIAPTSSQPLVT